MNEGFVEASFQPYAGTARPIDDVIEPLVGGVRVLRPGFQIGQWLHVDGSEYRGYRRPNGQLQGTCFVVSAARQATLDAINAQRAADETAGQQFDNRCEVLFAKARAHAQDTANPALTTREVNESIARLFRLARQLRNLT